MPADRRKQQNYERIIDLLTPSVWNALQGQNREMATSALLRHAWALGLRCPSEGTFGVLCNLVLLSNPAEQQRMSSFQRYSSVQDLKKEFKKVKHAWRDHDLVYTQYLDVLPGNQAALPAEYLLSPFQDENAIPCNVFTQ